jgi:hypothetical protein
LIVSADPLNVNPGGVVTVTVMLVSALKVPELPVMVTGAGPTAVAPLAAFSVSTCTPGLAPLVKLAVTPLGSPDTESATVPRNPPRSVTVIVPVVLPPWATDKAVGEADSRNPGGELTVRATVVLVFSAPEVPVIVTVTGPTAVALLLAVKVTMLYTPVGLGENEAVTPLGRPVADMVTAPANWFVPVTVIVLLALPPCPTVTLPGESESVKLGGGFTVTAIVVDAVSVPEVPVIVTITGPPSVAVLLAVSVIVLELVVGFGENDAVTPLGNPVAASMTLPANPPAPVKVIVFDPLPPCATEIPVGQG